MNLRHSYEAVILKRWDTGETDQIVSFLTRERGRLQGIAKGAKASRRRFGGALDLFSWVKLTFKEKKTGQLVVIEEARLLTHFPNIRRRYNAILLANGFLEMAYRFYREGASEPMAFDLLLGALKRLDESCPAPALFWRGMLANLKIVGLYPQFRQCIRCGKPSAAGPLSFDLRGGGIACGDCVSIPSRYRTLSAELVDWLSLEEVDPRSERPLEGRERPLEREDEKILEEVLAEHLKAQMDLDFRFHPFLDFMD